jgi:hypothetical protein
LRIFLWRAFATTPRFTLGIVLDLLNYTAAISLRMAHHTLPRTRFHRVDVSV